MKEAAPVGGGRFWKRADDLEIGSCQTTTPGFLEVSDDFERYPIDETNNCRRDYRPCIDCLLTNDS
ncbi:hypothetical protein AB3G45_03035 [Shinella sp. S4-D37]|uniref:hypothetical protein n=1 Tax=Shinella sp. S4-D37 TaxID=3161999 RepID=UPI0034670A24